MLIYEKPSWREKLAYNPEIDPQFIWWAGCSHTVHNLLLDGWEVSIQHNRFNGMKRMVMVIKCSATGGKLYSEWYKNTPLEALILTFVPNKLHRQARVDVREAVGLDLSEVPTLMLMELLEERLKAETPVIKNSIPPNNPAVLDFLAHFEAKQVPVETKEAVNE